MRRFLLIAFLLAVCLLSAKVWPARFYDSSGEMLSLKEMTDRLCDYDVVFFGEWHGDQTLQDLQVEVFDALVKDKGPVILSLEMYERDQQTRLDSLSAGRLDYETFVGRDRTWPTLNHELMRHALEDGSYILAANVPRRYAARIAREGTDWLGELEFPERALIADSLHVWPNEYQRRFYTTMTGSPELTDDLAPQMRAMMPRMFAAQCLKDDTMAMSIAHRIMLSSYYPTRVMHVCGEFHSSARLGTVSRLEARLPRLKIAVISPVAAIDESYTLPEEARGEGDFLIVLPAPAPDEEAPRAHPMPGKKEAEDER